MFAKTRHMAKLISSNGDVSPLCATTPRILNLKLSLWTNRKEAVTCRKCKALLNAKEKEDLY